MTRDSHGSKLNLLPLWFILNLGFIPTKPKNDYLDGTLIYRRKRKARKDRYFKRSGEHILYEFGENTLKANFVKVLSK